MRRRLLTGAAVVVAAGLGAGAVALAGHGNAAEPPPAAPTIATTKVERTDLANTQTFGATLGFGAVTTVKGTGGGTVTKLPAAGATAARGKALHWVDGRPVPVFFGDTPVFRPLDKPGIEGPDVAVLAANLTGLGYYSGTTTKTTPTLLTALKRWQDDTGLDPTGKLAPGQVLVVPGPVRVNSVSAQPGDPAASELFTVTATTRVITMPVEAGEVDQVHTGMAVTVLRPDGKSLPAKVSAVSTSVQGGDQDAQTGGPPKVDITITPAKQSSVSDLDSAAVQVQVVSQVHKGVLAVPVGALVALKGGGYAVQLPDGTFKAVRTGMFSRELVEISGAGISEGLPVVTTS